MQVSENLPYVASSQQNLQGNPTISTDFVRDVGTTLVVTPRIMPDGMVSLALDIERSSLVEWKTLGSGNNAIEAPWIRTSNATTTINAMDGQTVVFAGLITESKNTTNFSVPGLNRIPVVKHFFEYDVRRTERSELVIMLTPRIMRTQEDLNALNLKEYERMAWCIADVLKLKDDPNIRRRSEVWSKDEVRHTHGTSMPMQGPQVPPMAPRVRH